MQEERTLLKLMMKSGQIIQLFADDQSLAEIYQHPKFIPLFSSDNEVMVSLDDVIAFEVVKNVETLQPTDNVNAETAPSTSP